MPQGYNNERLAFSLSILLHVLVFSCLAATGLFTYLAAPLADRVVDVMVYDSDAGGGSAGSSAGGPDLSGGASSIIVNTDTKVPPISEKYTEEAQEAQKQEDRQVREDTKAGPVRASSGVVLGNSGGSGGTGTEGGGSGSEDGSGRGSGTGNGLGNGSGDGSGRSGRNSGDALKPKVPPQLVSSGQPAYPERLRRDGVEGQVVVKLVVGTDGTVENVSVVNSSGHGEMDKAAEEAAYGYRFTPAEDAYGEPVRCAVRQTIVFSLH